MTRWRWERALSLRGGLAALEADLAAAHTKPIGEMRLDEDARDLRARLEPEDHGARALLIEDPSRLFRLQPSEIPAQRREAAGARFVVPGARLLEMEIAEGRRRSPRDRLAAGIAVEVGEVDLSPIVMGQVRR